MISALPPEADIHPRWLTREMVAMDPLDFGTIAVEAHDSEELTSDGLTAECFERPTDGERLVRSA
jgi:hypothetical protein